MRVSVLVSKRFKETPADCQVESQALMIRGGYIKPVGNGIYTLLPIALRIAHKIEVILREEMNRIDGQEVLLPVAMPASLWRESGRYDGIGSELLRFRDRSGAEMVLGMTHEEAAVHLMRDMADSYAQYPLMIYQIQTKFRDEPRSRGGLIRVREFTMKDGYSFHTSQDDLAVYYARCFEAYQRIFARAGIPEVIAVQSDSGMMGGKVAHEYMLLADVGEDSLALCGACGYQANVENAPCITANESATQEPLQRVSTPGIKTIEDLSHFLSIPASQTAKAVIYQQVPSGKLVVAFLRGDLDVNETKLRNFLHTELRPAEIDPENSPLTAGFIGLLGLPEGIQTVLDQSLCGATNLVTGANEKDMHIVGLCMARDLGDASFTDIAKAHEGAPCPHCGQPLHIARGIEVGNIFQLGDRYTRAMGMQYIDETGALHHPLMGCYGIGVGRLIASICEVRRDVYGPLWPASIAPWQVELCSLRADDAQVAAVSVALYDALLANGIEVLWDDRPVSAGVMFSDADLFGVPFRAVISPKGIASGTVEIASRDKTLSERVPIGEAAARLFSLLEAELVKYEGTIGDGQLS